MTDFQAALGCSQAKSYKENLKRRKEIAKKYNVIVLADEIYAE